MLAGLESLAFSPIFAETDGRPSPDDQLASPSARLCARQFRRHPHPGRHTRRAGAGSAGTGGAAREGRRDREAASTSASDRSRTSATSRRSSHGSLVDVFYISNVEQYLFGMSSDKATDVNGGWRSFYENLAALPHDEHSVLVRGATTINATRPPCPMAAVLAEFRAGRLQTWADSRRCPVN
jgi:hypothetical protein